MKYTRRCQNCIWFDQCAQEVACEDYTPSSFDEQEEMQIAEYEDDLQKRNEYYKEYIDEQNS